MYITSLDFNTKEGLQSYFTGKADYCARQLETEQIQDKVLRLQECIKVYRSIASLFR